MRADDICPYGKIRNVYYNVGASIARPLVRCGTAVTDSNGSVTSVRDVSSLNIRIAREKHGCSKEIYDALFSSELQSIIIAGAPMSGKTTVLRDLVKTILRDRQSGMLCLASNTIDRLSPFFKELEISERVETMEQGDQEIITTPQGTKIYVEILGN